MTDASTELDKFDRQTGKFRSVYVLDDCKPDAGLPLSDPAD